MSTLLTGFLALGAGFYTLAAALGILRFPDALSRMHAASKAGVLGGALALLAAGIHFGGAGLWIKVMLALLLVWLTAPVGAHLLGRAALWRDRNR